MTHSLFDQMRAARYQPTPPPRVKPNTMARLARTSWRHAHIVLILWLLAVCAAGFVIVRNVTPPGQAAMQLPTAGGEAESFAAAFPGLDKLQTISLSNGNPLVLQQQRTDLVATMRAQREVYAFVFSPGAGDYYDSHGLLYHSLDDVKQRVAYALSLKPLFDAMGEAPNANSMATLVGEIAASIEQNREPRGLENLLSQAGASVQALMSGIDQPIDWGKVAALDGDSGATTATVLAVPALGAEDTARAISLRLINVLQSSSETQGALLQAEVAGKALPLQKPDMARTLAAGFMGLVFSALVVALALGRFRLMIVVFAPVFVMLTFATAMTLTIAGPQWSSLWCIPIAIALGTAQFSLSNAAAQVAACMGKPARETAVMLAAQGQGRNLVYLILLAACVWPFLAIQQKPELVLLGFGTFLLLIGSLFCTITLQPALLRFFPEGARWRAGDWLVPAHEALFESGRWLVMARSLAVVLLAAGLYLIVRTPQQEPTTNTDATVNLIAPSKAEAEALIAGLKSVPEANGVRWLENFLPDGFAEKQKAFSALKNQFGRITPVTSQAPDDVREQIDTLQEKLQNISALPKTTPEMRAAANQFRRSLALLGATSDDAQVKAFENRLFGGFNQLAERAEILSNLASPTEDTLPPELQQLFKSKDGQYRLEVSPAAGISNTQLALSLHDLGLPVVHQSVNQREASTTRYTRLMWLFGLGLTVAAALLMSMFKGSYALTSAGVNLAAGILLLLAAERLWQADWNVEWLTIAMTLFAYLAVLAASNARGGTLPAMDTIENFLLPAIANCVALPFLLLGVSTLAAKLLPLALGMALAATTTALLHSRERRTA